MERPQKSEIGGGRSSRGLGNRVQLPVSLDSTGTNVTGRPGPNVKDACHVRGFMDRLSASLPSQDPVDTTVVGRLVVLAMRRPGGSLFTNCRNSACGGLLQAAELGDEALFQRALQQHPTLFAHLAATAFRRLIGQRLPQQ